ncbi:MAG: uridine kinase family protein [Clostridium sp.]|uniref:uridine kinase family protein n=1 Tax=Clostridium sp. TaxID=1506 RepID=UPI003D6C7615
MKDNSPYHLHYQEMQESYAKYPFVFAAVEKLTKANTPSIIAIEGRCGSGKSSLAAILAEMFDCNLFHMDDFFLPYEMKTKERLAKSGGNIYYERFQTEVITHLQNREAITYQPYSCVSGTLGQSIHVEPKKVTIIEGVYCLHPTLLQYYDLKIFLTLNSQVQKERILRRSGEDMFQKYLSKWIPMEEQYFLTLNIEERCDIVVDTSDLFI